METNPVCVKVADGVFVGNVAAVKSDLLSKNNITAVINVSGDDMVTRHNYYEFILPNKELLPTEYQKVLSRLASIKTVIVDLIKQQNIFICCYEGRNQSLLVAGYYMITIGNTPASVVRKLETLYFDQQMIADEERDQLRAANADPDAPAEVFTEEEFRALQASRELRRGLRGLTITSFASLLLTVR